MPVELGTEQIVDYGQIGASILLMVALGTLSYYFTSRAINAMYHRNLISEGLRGVCQVILRWAIIALVVLVSLQQTGVRITSIWAALSAFVVLIGVGMVAVWSVLSNMLCSLLLLVFRPFSIGDRVEIIEATGGNGLQGKVVNLNLLYTYLLENNRQGKDGAIILIPNNMFFQKTTRRWSGTRTKNLEEAIFKDDSQSMRQNMSL